MWRNFTGSKLKCLHSWKFKTYKRNETKKTIVILLAVLFLVYNFLYWTSFQKAPSEEILGWERNKSRNTRDYVFPDKITTQTSVKHSCSSSSKQFILIMICSDIKRAKSRQAIRETWAANAQQNNISVLFLTGRSTDEKLNILIHEENSEHADIVVEDFIDTYNNLTLKSVMMLKWINQNCLSARFIMKVDDDVYVNIDNLLKAVSPVNDGQLSGFLLGKLYTREKPYRSVNEKWYMPYYMFADESYPHYLCGVGYIMSSQVAIVLYEESLKNELVYLEDLFITGICAKKAGLQPLDHLGFHFFEHAVTVECNSIHAHLTLLSHHLSASQMQQQHEQILEC